MKIKMAAAAAMVALSCGDASAQSQPIGWMFARYLYCVNESVCTVSVGADGVNVRDRPNGHAIGALVNGVPLFPLEYSGDWVLVAPACPLAPTGVWSDTAGVPLGECAR